MANTGTLKDRTSAGRELAQKLLHLKGENPLVLGLPRGGIPVAFEVAQALDATLEPFFVKKISAPWQKELAIGAVTDGSSPELILNEYEARLAGASDDYIRSEMKKKLGEIERSRRLYLADQRPSDPNGRAVILVDDGIATGSTVKAALAVLRKSQPVKLVLAVPVLPADRIDAFEVLVDELVFLAAPARFGSVGAHFRDFRQVCDAEVVELLNRHALDQTPTDVTPQ